MSDTIVHAQEPGLDPDDFIALLQAAGLAGRPVRDPHRIQRMIEGADILLTARDGTGALVGIARSVTDFSYCCYLSDLAVDLAWQGRGIGRELIRRTHDLAGTECNLVLLSAPDAMSYYPHAGLNKADNAFALDRER